MSDATTTIEVVRKLFKEGFVVIDLETTGFPQDPNVEIIEVAVIGHNDEVLMDTLVKPTHRIPYGASRVNGIYDEDVVNAEPFMVHHPQLVELLSNRHVIAYNHTFEQAIFERVLTRHNQPLFPVTQWHCAMRIYRRFMGYRKFVKLTEACRQQSVTVANAHRALGDCIMTLELMKKIAG